MGMNKDGYGMLYVCPTPIGNLKDVTLRVIEVLKEVDLIACEDTRDSGKFLSHYDIHTPLTSYHQHNRVSKGEYLIEQLKEGKEIALISDAGMPGISDPGEDFVRACIDEGIDYTVLPGASASITALVGSGISTGRFVFEGFLPKVGKERKERLFEISKEKRTIILYESPHNLLKTLKDISEFPEEREMTLTREISKKFEERIFTTTKRAFLEFEEKAIKGEFVIIIEGRSKEAEQEEIADKYRDLSLSEHIKLYENQGLKRNEAMKRVAADLGTTKRDIYNRFELERNL